MVFILSAISGKDVKCEKSFMKDGKCYVEIDSIEDLINLRNEVGSIILSKRLKNEITVYDDYL